MYVELYMQVDTIDFIRFVIRKTYFKNMRDLNAKIFADAGLVYKAGRIDGNNINREMALS